MSELRIGQLVRRRNYAQHATPILILQAMTLEQLRTAHRATPFLSFTIHLTDGRSVDVPHPDFLSHSPSGRTIIVHHPDDSYSVIDLLLVTELKFKPNLAPDSRKAS